MERQYVNMLEKLSKSVAEFDSERAKEAALEAINAGLDPLKAIDEGLAKGIRIIGDLFERKEAFLPELIMAGEAMKAGTQVLMEEIRRRGLDVRKLGAVLIGTVHGDLHDIGKNIVISMLESAGFEVIDLGVDVPAEIFVKKVEELTPDVLGMSALLTTTAPGQEKVIEMLKEAGLRGKVKVMIGGAATSERWANEIGADAYAADAIEAVRKIKALLGVKEG